MVLIKGSEDHVDFGPRTPCSHTFFLFNRSFISFYLSHCIHFMEIIQMLPKSSALSFIVLKIWQCTCWPKVISNAQGQENTGWGRKFTYIMSPYIMVSHITFPPLTLRLMVRMELRGLCSVLRPLSCTFPRACVTLCEALYAHPLLCLICEDCCKWPVPIFLLGLPSSTCVSFSCQQ